MRTLAPYILINHSCIITYHLLVCHDVVDGGPVHWTRPIPMPSIMTDAIAGAGATDVRQLQSACHIDEIYSRLHICVNVLNEGT